MRKERLKKHRKLVERERCAFEKLMKVFFRNRMNNSIENIHYSLNWVLLQKENILNYHHNENFRYTGQIPVYKVGTDARELTSRELLCYQSILSEHNVNESEPSMSDESNSVPAEPERHRRLRRLSVTRVINTSESHENDDGHEDVDNPWWRIMKFLAVEKDKISPRYLRRLFDGITKRISRCTYLLFLFFLWISYICFVFYVQ